MRRKNDLYETSAKAVEMLLDEVDIYGEILEPCAGKGAISTALTDRGYRVITNDLHESGHTYALDAREPDIYREFDGNWVVTNPPFSQAFKILKAAYDSGKNVALLLRLSFLEPVFERQDFLSEHPPTHLVVLPRYSFTGNGKTDSVTCAWMVWDHNTYDQLIAIKKKPAKKNLAHAAR